MQAILKRAVALRFLFFGAEEAVDLPAAAAAAARTSAAGSAEVLSAAAAVSGAAAVGAAAVESGEVAVGGAAAFIRTFSSKGLLGNEVEKAAAEAEAVVVVRERAEIETAERREAKAGESGAVLAEGGGVGGNTARLGGGGQHLLKQFLTVGGVMLFQMLAIPDAPKKLGEWKVVMVKKNGGAEDAADDEGGGGAARGGGGQHTSAYVKVLQYPEIRHSICSCCLHTGLQTHTGYFTGRRTCLTFAYDLRSITGEVKIQPPLTVTLPIGHEAILGAFFVLFSFSPAFLKPFSIAYKRTRCYLRRLQRLFSFMCIC
jgi:hypothetical protein